MKNKYLSICIIIILFTATKIKSQDFINYNLNIQNPVLYNPAYVIDSSVFKAFVNSHLQWVGFDGAPKINTFGFYINPYNNMGFGVSISNSKQGITSNTNINLSYAYKINFEENHFLTFGLGFGVILDELQKDKILNADITDQTITNNNYGSTSYNSMFGMVYYFKRFKLQAVMPQIYRKNKYTPILGSVSYDFLLNNYFNLKPVFMLRYAETSPMQYNINFVTTYQKSIFFQIGYKSNQSFLFGVGVNYKGFEIGYAYQMESNYMSTIGQTSHEIQLISRFGKNRAAKKKISSSTINGKIIDATSKKSLKAEIHVFDGDKEIDKTQSDELTGNYSLKINNEKKYIIKISAPNYYDSYNLIVSNDENLSKNAEILLFSENTNINGTIKRKVDNKKINGIIKVFENDTEIYKTQASNGVFNFDVKSGKTYKFELSSNLFSPISQKIEIPKKTISKDIEFIVDFMPYVSGTITEQSTNLPISAKLIISKNKKTIKTINSEGDYIVKLESNTIYDFEYTSTGYYSQKIKVDLTNQDVIKENITLVKVIKEAFTLGQINFETDKAVLTLKSLPILDNFVKVLEDNPDFKFEIAGHTDNLGNARTNQQLSFERAQACVNYIVSKGIAPYRLKAVGYGQTRPLAPNNIRENRAKNRRVEAKVIK